jgi:hypothetical protein
MLFCISAPNAPISIDSAEMIATICCQDCCVRAERDEQHMRQQATAAIFGRGREERHNRRGRALVNVRRPDVERRGRSLESQSADHEHQAEDQADDTGAAAITE